MPESENPYIVAKSKLDAYIAANGLRNTQERFVLLEHICALPQPFGADKLVVFAKERHISPATVYNTLTLLVSAQILHCLSQQYGRSKSMYELSLTGKIRFEFVCTRCGRVSRFKDRAIENIIRMRRFPNFVPNGFSMYVYGECKTCKRKPLSDKKPSSDL